MTTGNDGNANGNSIHSEAHPTAEWGDPIHIYTRGQALQDGVLVDVSGEAAEIGFRFPVALTRAVYADCIAWDVDHPQVFQDPMGRLCDVLWLASLAAKRGQGNRVEFDVFRVPSDGSSSRPKPVTLQMQIGPGDHGEPVLTIMLPGED